MQNVIDGGGTQLQISKWESFASPLVRIERNVTAYQVITITSLLLGFPSEFWLIIYAFQVSIRFSIKDKTQRELLPTIDKNTRQTAYTCKVSRWNGYNCSLLENFISSTYHKKTLFMSCSFLMQSYWYKQSCFKDQFVRKPPTYSKRVLFTGSVIYTSNP